MAVQWDKEKGLNGWGVDFWNTIRGIKKDLPEVNAEIKQFIGSQDDLKGKNPESLEWIRPQLIQDAEELSNVTDELKDDFTSFLETADLSGDILKQYQAHLKKTGKSVNDFSSFTKKAGNVLKSFGATLGSMFVNWAIGKAIDFVATKLDNLANVSKHAAESAQALASEMNDSISSISSNASTLSELNDEYQTLSKGVNQLGENIGLSTEDYNKYKNIISQLSEIMPNLTMYFNAQGEKIAFAKGKLADLNKEYDDYIKKQAIDYVTNGDSEGNKIQGILDNYNSNESFAGFEKFWKGFKNSAGFVDIEDFTSKEILKELEGLEKATSIDEILEKLNYDQNVIMGNYFDRDSLLKHVILNQLGLTKQTRPELESMTESEYNALMQNIISYIQSYNAKIESDMNQVHTALFQEAYSKDKFWAIKDNDIRDNITTFLSSIDSNIWDALNIKTENDLSTFVNKIIESLANNKDGFNDAWNGLFNPELKDLPVDEYAKQVDDFIGTICNTLGLDEVEGVHILKVALGFDDIPKRLKDSIRSITDDHGITDRDEYSYLMNEIDFQSFTQEQAELWLEATSGAQNATEAVQKYKDALAEQEDKDPITFSSVLSDETLSKFQSTIDSLKSSLTTLYNGDYSSTELISALTSINKAMSDIGKSESINWEEITNIDDLDNIIDQITNDYVDTMLNSLDMSGTEFGDTIRNVIQEELKASRQLETYKNNVSDLQSAYSNLTDVIETYNETGYITFDQLTSLLEMEPQYLSCLIDENGQLQLNQESMLALANQRLNDAEAQAVQQAITELGQLALQDEKTAVEENAQAFSNAVNDLAAYNEELAGTIGEGSIASSVIRDLNAAISGAASQGATDVQIGTVLDNLNTKLQLIRTTRLNLDKSLGGIIGGKSSSSSNSSSANNYKEQFDFFERRVEVLNNAVNLLKTNLENVAGSFARNQLLDQSSSILEERMRNYSDAAKMYQQKAQESLSKLDLETQKKIIDGSVNLTDYIGEGNKAVVEAMNDYKGWADKVAECIEELAGLKEELRQLELEKFNHIIQDFTDQFDLRDNAKSLIDKQIDLFKEAGELIGESFYTAQIDQSQKQLSLLENEKAQLVNQMSSAISSGRVNCCPLLQ